jgi:hypothetical protein
LARNPLQTGSGDGNALGLAPWRIGDPTDPMVVAGARNTVAGVDALTAWLAEQRAKTVARAPIWNPANPVGTETVQSVGMPQPTTYAGPVGQFIDPATGRMTERGAARMDDNPMLGFDTGGVGMIKGFHGSPHLFPPTAKNPLGEFSDVAIGTGTGGQHEGVGHYIAGAEPVAKEYRDMLMAKDFKTSTGENLPDWLGNSVKQIEDQFGKGSRLHQEIIDKHIADFERRRAETQKGMAIDPQPWMAEDRIANFNNIITGLEKLKSGDATLPPRGHMYEVNIDADPEQFIHWDKPLREQPPAVQALLGHVDPSQPIGAVLKRAYGNEMHGGDLLGKPTATPEEITHALRDAGIPGVRYRDKGDRGVGEGSYNFVVFDPATMEIIRRYGLAGLLGGGAAATQQQQPNALRQ